MKVDIQISGSRAVAGRTEYIIKVEQEDHSILNLRKYYSDFVAFDRAVAMQFPTIRRMKLPEKGAFGVRHQLGLFNFNDQRQKGLQLYLKSLVAQFDFSSLTSLQFFAQRDSLESRERECDIQGPRAVMVPEASTEVSIIRGCICDEYEELDAAWADKTPLLAYEVFMGNMPVENSGVFAVAFILGGVDAAGLTILKDGLRRMIIDQPILAGRVHGRHVALCNAGVPFSEVRCEVPSPTSIAHAEVLTFCDVRSPKNIMDGLDPLLTVKAHVHTDGVAIGVAVSHAVMDGSTLFNFLRGWGDACRGDTSGVRGIGSRVVLQKLLRTTDQRRDSGQVVPSTLRKVGEALSRFDDYLPQMLQDIEESVTKRGSSLALCAASALVPPCLGLGGAPSRFHLHVTAQTLVRIKDLATPPPGSGGDGWVSTQEALVAHLAISLWETFVRSTAAQKTGRACISFLMDIRRFIGVADTLAFGTGFQVCSLYIEDMNNKNLMACAMEVHEGCRKFGESAAARWSLWHRAFEYRVDSEAFLQDLRNQQSSDLSLTINNNSKRQGPNFGAAAGGRVTQFASSMGPTLFLPAEDGGIDVLLQSAEVAKASEEKLCELIRRFGTYSPA